MTMLRAFYYHQQNWLNHKKDRTRQVLKNNGDEESIINKNFKRITKNDSFFQLQQQTQTTNTQQEENRTNFNCGSLKVVLKKYDIYSDLA